MEVLGIEHVDLTVNQLDVSTHFYTTILERLGFKRFDHPAKHVSWSNGKLSTMLRPAALEERGATHSRYRVGLHHLAFKATRRRDVDELYQLLLREKLTVLDPPADYPEYGAGYYAVFFADPDGLKPELVHFPWGYWKRVQTDGKRYTTPVRGRSVESSAVVARRSSRHDHGGDERAWQGCRARTRALGPAPVPCLPRPIESGAHGLGDRTRDREWRRARVDRGSEFSARGAPCNGRMFIGMTEATLADAAMDEEDAERLWELSVRLTDHPATTLRDG